jgi:hypothetical protein
LTYPLYEIKNACRIPTKVERGELKHSNWRTMELLNPR